MNSYCMFFFLTAENHAAENTGPVELQGNQMNQNTQKSTWRKNCKKNGLCDVGSRSVGNYCDTRDYKILSHDFCGKCRYGWRRPWLSPNDWCCSYHDYYRYGDCKCHASNAPECPNAQGKKSNWYCNIRINFFRTNID